MSHVTLPTTAYMVAGYNIQNVYKMCYVLQIINFHSHKSSPKNKNDEA